MEIRFGVNLKQAYVNRAASMLITSRKQWHTSQVDTQENNTRWRDKDMEESELGRILQTVLKVQEMIPHIVLVWEDP